MLTAPPDIAACRSACLSRSSASASKRVSCESGSLPGTCVARSAASSCTRTIVSLRPGSGSPESARNVVSVVMLAPMPIAMVSTISAVRPRAERKLRSARSK